MLVKLGVMKTPLPRFLLSLCANLLAYKRLNQVAHLTLPLILMRLLLRMLSLKASLIAVRLLLRQLPLNLNGKGARGESNLVVS